MGRARRVAKRREVQMVALQEVSLPYGNTGPAITWGLTVLGLLAIGVLLIV